MIPLLAKPALETLNVKLRSEIIAFTQATGIKPQLAVILIGQHPSSEVYVKHKQSACEAFGLSFALYRFKEDVDLLELKNLCCTLNTDPTVHGILIQRPIPGHLTERDAVFLIAPEKDVDGLHPENIGRYSLRLPGHIPCTALGVLRLLDHYKLNVSGSHCVVAGRSAIVGRPLTQLLSQRNATVTEIHSQTPNPKDFLRLAKFVFLAIGKPHLFSVSDVSIGAYVFDVGITRDDSGKLLGDFNPKDAETVLSGLTPVPGGIGPMTIYCLMENTLRAAKNLKGLE